MPCVAKTLYNQYSIQLSYTKIQQNFKKNANIFASDFRNNLETTTKVHEVRIAFAFLFQYNKEDIR